MNAYYIGQDRSESISQHGIMGMKWGVRRFQNPDGSLTELGKKRMLKVKYDEKLNKKDTADAIKIYGANKANADMGYKWRAGKAAKYENKAKYYEELGNADRAAKFKEKSKLYAEKGKKYLAVSDELNKKINSIMDGTAKAGRDFMIQKDYNAYIIPIPGPVPAAVGIVNRQKTVINVGDTSRYNSNLEYLDKLKDKKSK